jgi:hypothetical protein
LTANPPEIRVNRCGGHFGRETVKLDFTPAVASAQDRAAAEKALADRRMAIEEKSGKAT